MHAVKLASIVCYEIMAGVVQTHSNASLLLATEVCPKGRKHIGGGEAPVYEKYQIYSPNGAAEIMEIIINIFHPFGLEKGII
ncbi:MAG: hypothetical protein NUV74_06735 [Candidatus Brocadiaceae bacterium]|nr:hypothetical protein [Candidatus Brocadiaceae bacterium]